MSVSGVVAKPNTFSNKEANNFGAFSYTLRKIHNRLLQEGYIIKNGRLEKDPPEEGKK